MRNLRGSMLAVAFCIIGTVHVALAASLKSNKQIDPVEHQQHQQSPARGVQRRTRSAEQWLALISVSGNTSLQLLLITLPAVAAKYQQSLQIESAAPKFAALITTPNVSPLNTEKPLITPNAPHYIPPLPNISQQTPPLPNISQQRPPLPNISQQTPPLPNISQQTPSLPNISQQTPPLPNISQQTPPLPNISQQTPPLPNISQQTPGPNTNQLKEEISIQNTSIGTKPPPMIKHDINDLPPDKIQHKPHHLTDEERRAQHSPVFLPVENSQQLLLQFQAQKPETPSLPPVVIEPLVVNTADDEVVEVQEAAQELQPSSFKENGLYGNHKSPENCRNTCQESAYFAQILDPVSAELPSPPLPRFERSLMLKAVLTVPRADYSENYTLWWDAASGASRIEHHGGTASSYRIMRPDGRVQSVHVRLDRTGELDARRCTILKPRRVTLDDRRIPILPDLSDFKFDDYIDVKPIPGAVLSRVERWIHTVSATTAANVSSPGEVLTYRHELIVARTPDNLTTTPLRYAVAVDSSVLGQNCDSYVHRFLKVYSRHHDSSTFSFDLNDACDSIEKTSKIELVEPLREFTILQRDSQYDRLFTRFKNLYNRQYLDDLEETIRKNIMIQSSRFISSGNRKGSSFELELNFLSDRLSIESKPLLGIDFSVISSGDKFPYRKAELRRLSAHLPLKFDWREHGGVTHVRDQNPCAACWAFAVTGAVEGALFARTGRLVPLSEQVLVDCGHRSGTSGCSPTWPQFAYNYIRDHGLPALDEYSPYVAEVQECRSDRVAPVTRITSFVNVTTLDLIALKVAIRKHGPTVVLIDGSTQSFKLHKKGFYHDAKCKKKYASHAVLAVGWTVHRHETYFILKNSWNTGWGEDGYVYMRGKTNTCGLLRLPSYPVLMRNDVLRIPTSARVAVPPVKSCE